jgi:hypothetical protein
MSSRPIYPDNPDSPCPNLARIVMAVLACLVLAMAATSCTSTPAFTLSMRSTYDAVAPEYVAYVSGDAKLTAEQKAIRLATVDRWQQAIAAEEVRK